MLLLAWLFGATQQILSARKERSWRRVVTVVAGTLMMIGALGFFGAALSAIGALNWLPSSFEWPAGYTKGVVSTADNYHLVPHTPSGRVQVYDRSWKFLRGWNVDAGAGTFKLYITDTNHIHVVTARGRMHYVYEISGKLLSSESYEETGANYSTFGSRGSSYAVPTPFWLYVFSSPFYSWLAAGAGIGLFVLRDKVFKRK